MPSFYFTPDEMCTSIKLEMKRIQDFFIANDWVSVPTVEEADVVLCTTCSGWSKLEQNSLRTLASLQDVPGTVISVGCVNEVNPEGVTLVHSGPRIAIRNLESIEAFVDDLKVRLTEVPTPSTFRTREDYRLYDLSKRYVNICLGCSFACSYCPHRVGLGKLRSRAIEDILDQIRSLIQEEVRIVVLTGMETALYGRDIETAYPELLRQVLDIDDRYDVHVAQFHPVGVEQYFEELVELCSSSRVTDIQIPIQTTSRRLLKMMNRPPLPERFAEFLARVKAANPKVILRTDLIIGFPTETMQELEDTLAFATTYFDEVASYAIELRKGLPAEKYMADQYLPQEIDRRVKYAVNYVESRGSMAHGGQQSDVSLIEIETRKQAMRKAKGQS